MVLLCLLGVFISMLIIWRACDGFEVASGYLGRNLSEGVRGATINAIASSVPELLTTGIALFIYFDREGFAFGIGTTAGSAIFNGAVIPSLVILTVIFAGMTRMIKVSKKVVLRDGLFLIGGELLLIKLLSDGHIDWLNGFALISYYVAYVGFMIYSMEKANDETKQQNEDAAQLKNNNKNSLNSQSRFFSILKIDLRTAILGRKKLTTLNAWILLGAATAVMGMACHMLVESCYKLGSTLGIHYYYIAVIIAAMATSVPDTVISIKDAKEGDYDDAVANALGSNIFDICVCLGLPLMIYCLVTGQSIDINSVDQTLITELRIFLLLSTIIIFFILLLGKGVGLFKGITMFGIYVLFVVYIFMRAEGKFAIPGIQSLIGQ